MDNDSIKVFKCHNCGKGMGFVQGKKGELVKEGRVADSSVIAMRQTRVLLTDKPPQTQLSCPVVTVVEDVCEFCGVIFVRELRSGTVIAKPNLMGPNMGHPKLQ